MLTMTLTGLCDWVVLLDAPPPLLLVLLPPLLPPLPPELLLDPHAVIAIDSTAVIATTIAPRSPKRTARRLLHHEW